MINIFVQMF